MTPPLPAKLKAADLNRFNLRATQLEKAKPVIAYWCEYWIVNQILSKGLHNDDPETLQYTTTLMDKLEQIKAENATNDAIMDDTAGQAYVEQFGVETFLRADRAVEANKVTKQTADTFSAAATFLELVNIWSPPDAETAAKIKYAKWNAVRIMKAFKDGQDPNESNPKPQSPVQDLPMLDPQDPEVQQLDSRQPYVEDVPDDQDQVEAGLAKQSTIDRSIHSSAQVSNRASPRMPQDHQVRRTGQEDNVSPLEPSPNERTTSAGGGYFPEVPTFASETRDPTTLTASAPDNPPNLGLPDTSNMHAPGAPPVDPSPQDFYRQAPPPVQPPQPQYGPPPTSSHPPAFAPSPAQALSPPPAPVPHHAELNQGQLITDDVAVAKAQKHARFAISALNFEDVPTAVKELRAALQTLGA